MKLKILLLALLVWSSKNIAQTTIIPDQDTRVITTGIPFSLIAPDARAAGMGDMGVATSPDAFSQAWNASKYAFSESKTGFSLSYTPYLSKLVNDIGLAYLSYYNRINENSAFGASFRYFSLGEIEFRKTAEDIGIIQKPNEFTLDLSYSLRLSEQFSMGVGMRYLRSDLKLQTDNVDAKAASSFGVDISGYYQSEEEAYSDFNGRWRGGFAIQNLGPKFKYDEGGQENFQPTNLRLGGGFDFIFNEYSKLGVTVEVTKLLVPTPPITGKQYAFNDNNGNGVYDPENGTVPVSDPNSDTDTLIQSSQQPVIISGQSQDVGFMSGVFQSFGDAPGGFKEELQEFTYAIGAEYLYKDAFAFRLGYFNEHETKGARNFFALGAGFKYNVVGIDLSYLFSSAKVQSPLENTLRFSLTFDLGPGAYTEY